MRAAGVDHEKAIWRPVHPDAKFLLELGVDAQAVFGGVSDFEGCGWLEQRARKEEAEKKIVESYLPAAASEEEMIAAVESAIAETGATTSKQIGLVMKAVQAKLAGKTVDGKFISEKVKAKLA